MNIIPTTAANAGNDPTINALDAVYAAVALSGSADVLPVAPGTYFVTATGVDAMTLATPVAGLPSAGGNDGQTIEVIDVGGHAHTITSASNKIVPSHHVLTFGGTAGSVVKLKAYQGLYYVLGATGVTAS